MGLFTGFLGTRQHELHVGHDINDLERIGAEAMAAVAANPMQRLAYLPGKRTAPKALAASRPRRQYRATPRASSKQLNVRVTTEEHAALRRYARQQRITLTDAMRRGIALLTAPQ